MLFPFLSPAQRFERARSIYETALRAPLYARKYAGIAAPADEAGWRKLPLLTRQELWDNAFPRSRDLLTQPVERMMVCSTGGTSGVARYTLNTYEEWDLFCDMQARTLKLMGIGPSDRVANLFIAGHLWPSFLGAHEIIKRIGAVHLPISANIPEEEIVKLCLEFDPTVMISLPTLFIFLADLAIKDGLRFPSLRLIGYAGEAMSQQVQDHLRRGLGVKEIRALAYTSADAGLMGYQCASCSSNEYHWPTDFHYLEIIRPETGDAAGIGEKGEVVITSLATRSMPIVRYLIGDVGFWKEGTCSCGDPNPVFQLAGRAGEDFKLGGAFISMRVVEEAVAEGGMSLNFNLEIEDIANQFDFVLRIEAAEPDKVDEGLELVKLALRKRIHQIPTMEECHYLRRFEVLAAPLGSLPRNPWTGKVTRLTDKRVAD